MSRAENKEKKLAVLEIVRKNKNILFGSVQNNFTTKIEKEAAWKEVLEKAQSLGLASANREWTYARDHLFGLWKSRTLAKRVNARRTETWGGKTSNFNIVDNCILDIIGSDSNVDLGPSLPKSYEVETKIEPQISETESVLSSNETVANAQGIKRKSENCTEIERLKIAVLESQLYKNKLEILVLENKLKHKRSKFTHDFGIAE